MSRKVFSFGMEIDGLDVALAQDVKLPDVEVGKVEHGDTNYNKKTAGGVTTGDCEIQKLKAVGSGDNFAWDWLTQAQNPATGGGGLPEDYKRDVVIKEFAPDGITTLDSYLLVGCFVMKISNSNYKRGAQDENMIETVTLSVDRVEKLV